METNMKTLIIHPDDRSTDFLKDIYRGLDNVTVVTKNISRGTLHELIRSHDQIVMLGHGSASGLFNVSRIGGDERFTIGYSEVPLLKDKQCIFIWCHADQFVRTYRLKGLSSGMFISEVSEARYCNVKGNMSQVKESNSIFANLLGNVILEASSNYKAIHSMVGESYDELAEVNPVARYNAERWYIFD